MRLELTSRSAYAIRAMVAIARMGAGRPPGSGSPVPVSHIAEEMAIPRRFLPQVMGDLVRAGLVTAQLGRGGGYALARPASHIQLLEIIEASEGDTRRTRCVLAGIACGASAVCEVHAVFDRAQRALRDTLSGFTVADVLERPEVR